MGGVRRKQSWTGAPGIRTGAHRPWNDSLGVVRGGDVSVAMTITEEGPHAGRIVTATLTPLQAAEVAVELALRARQASGTEDTPPARRCVRRCGAEYHGPPDVWAGWSVNGDGEPVCPYHSRPAVWSADLRRWPTADGDDQRHVITRRTITGEDHR